MPLFDYLCRKCGHEFEALVRPPVDSNGPLRCPECGAADLEKQLPTFAVDTAEKRAASAKQSRQRQIAKRKDALVADEEYRQKHDKE